MARGTAPSPLQTGSASEWLPRCRTLPRGQGPSCWQMPPTAPGNAGAQLGTDDQLQPRLPRPVLPPPTAMVTRAQLVCSAEPSKPPPCAWTPVSREGPPPPGAALRRAPWEPVPAQPRSGGPGEPPHARTAPTQPAIVSSPAALLLPFAFASSRNCFDLHSRGSLLKINVSWMLLPMA